MAIGDAMDFLDRMAIGRTNAKRDRERGGSTVKVYATTRAMYAARGGNVGPGTWEHCLAEARSRWQSARTQAIEDLHWELYGDQWEGL
jgi:hypothetical protein